MKMFAPLAKSYKYERYFKKKLSIRAPKMAPPSLLSPIASLQKGKTPLPTSVQGMTLNCIWWGGGGGSNPKVLGNIVPLHWH